jgi:hypothetical protein
LEFKESTEFKDLQEFKENKDLQGKGRILDK